MLEDFDLDHVAVRPFSEKGDSKGESALKLDARDAVRREYKLRQEMEAKKSEVESLSGRVEALRVENQRNERLTTYVGNCHCGGYRFEIHVPEVRKVDVCDCSICARVSFFFFLFLSLFLLFYLKLESLRGCLVYKHASLHLLSYPIISYHIIFPPTVHVNYHK